MIKTIMMYSLKERKKIREQLETLKTNMTKQRKHSYNLFIKPLDDRLSLIERFSKNEISAEVYTYKIDKINKYIKEVANRL